jgi:hypothetical protein
MRTDLSALRAYITLPAGDFRCKWALRAAAVGGSAPGPSDASLIAYVELSQAAWQNVAPAAPEAEELIPPARDNEITLSLAMAKQLLPDDILERADRVQDDQVVLRGSALSRARLARMPWRTTRAIRVGDALLLMAATS